MNFFSTRLPYRQTGALSKLVLDYLDRVDQLKDFYAYPPTLQGIEKTIEDRQKHAVNRKVLVDELKKQYATVAHSKKVGENIEALRNEKTFTITTAHQNNLFTGPLYFTYKIIHAIKLTAELNDSLPGYRFVPVFYMGTEDADFAELNHFYLDGEKLEWKTDQAGAVGRMVIDKKLTSLIKSIEGQLGVLPFGPEIIQQLRKFYKEGNTIQHATFEFLNYLFGNYGLLVLLPDNPGIKNLANGIFRDELINQSSGKTVNETLRKLESQGYKSQAHPREINLFYLNDGIRERIEKQGVSWKVLNSKINFSKSELIKELETHPERFSPNVILRGIYQEAILPNVVFIGGGGELSYWLQYKELFEYFNIPFPVLVLRNSFLVIEKRWQEIIVGLGLDAEDFFLAENQLMKKWLMKSHSKNMQLNGGFTDAEQLYQAIKDQVSRVDPSLVKHVEALKTNTLYRLQELEKKILKAEKRKYADQQRQIEKIRLNLFPNGQLQERTDNLLYYYSKWGRDFLDELYKHSLSLEQEFTILQEK